MDLWQKQLIRSLFHYSSKRMNIERAFVVKHPHVPDYLYKYRQFKASHLDALNRGVLWMSSPDRFNDPYDAAVSFDTDRFLVEDQSVQDFIASGRELSKKLTTRDGWRPKQLVHPIEQGVLRQRVMSDLLKNLDIANRNEIVFLVEKFSKDKADENVRRLSSAFRQNFSVLSLSENCSSNLMWSHYADSHKGFAIEYNFLELSYHDLRRRLCFPVFYTRKPRDATRYMARTDMLDYNNLFGEYMCLIKQDKWAYEKEWRVIYAIGEVYANAELQMQKPSAVILGSQVLQADETAMRSLCQAQKIPLKRMVQQTGSFDGTVIDVEN